MFPKFNLSRLSGFAALGIIVAVLGGCAEGTSGSRFDSPLVASREDISRTRFENPEPRVDPAATSMESIISSRKLASHRPVHATTTTH
jgi:hypothetical protein